MTPVGLAFKGTGAFYPASCRRGLPLLVSLTPLMERRQTESLRHHRAEGEEAAAPSQSSSLPTEVAARDRGRPGHSRPVQPSAEYRQVTRVTTTGSKGTASTSPCRISNPQHPDTENSAESLRSGVVCHAAINHWDASFQFLPRE